MSLAGNLSDLSLAELLQVVALSRKTGALEICADDGVAWLGLRDGGIVRVATEDGAVDRSEVLKRMDVDPEAEPDVAEATLWDAAVHTILRIFEWREGEFTFEPLDDPAETWRGPEGIVLPTALSPEFLALEGARIEDEGGFAQRTHETPEPTPPVLDAYDDSQTAGKGADDPNDWSDLNDDDTPSTPVPISDAARAEAEAALLPEHTPAPAIRERSEGASEAIDERPTPPFERSALAEVRVVVCVHPELALLEEMKRALASPDVRVHIFQSAPDALARMKQYIVRGAFPALVTGSEIEDPVAAPGSGWRPFVERIRRISPRTRVVLLTADDTTVGDDIRAVVCPEFRTAMRPEIDELIAGIRAALGTGVA